MKEIPLNYGYVALVDDEDFERLSKKTWYSLRPSHSKNVYAVHSTSALGPKLRMHRVIMGVTDPKIGIDHIDGNGLNNQKSNLRTCNQIQNGLNSRLSAKSKSGFKGVSQRKLQKSWTVKVTIEPGKKKHIGTFKCKVEAAKAYDEAAKKYYGEFARLNFP